MREKEFFRWLAQSDLLDYVTKHYPCFQRIFRECLNATNEKILIIGDLGTEGRRIPPIMAACYHLAARKLNLEPCMFIKRDSLDKRGSSEIENALVDSGEGNIICLSLSGKLGTIDAIGKSFRRFTGERKHRFVSTPGLDALPTNYIGWIAKTINVNYNDIHWRGERIKGIFDTGKELHVRTRAGTDLYYGINGMKAINNSGRYHQPCLGGNMPAGEVYIPCSNSKVHGRVVIDASIRTEDKSIMVNNKVTLDIENGTVISIKGRKEAELLQRAIESVEKDSNMPETARMIGEFGIGINPNAKIIGSTLVNEKALGTAHIAIGSNHWFGGSIHSPIHLDQVFYEPIVKVDGKLLNGRFLM
ncbi:aminopeptidase [Candidatus Woesearchaeota archaeon]|nr:aminopeptidase [Candidatus Woesearchaeota archaeon]